jgi:hypothetical protein
MTVGEDVVGMPPQSLAQALDDLVEVGQGAGLDAAAARAEGAALAATVAESAPRAAQDWARQLGSTVQGFFDAAVPARRWRDAPTTLLAALVAARSAEAGRYAQALVEVCAAACDLGEPTTRVADNASVAGAAQLRAAELGLPPSGVLGDDSGGVLVGVDATPAVADRTRAVTEAVTGTVAETVTGAVTQTAPPKTLEELLGELDGLTGLQRVKAEVHRQAQVLRVEQLRAAANLRNATITRHLVFLGNPGTGKTTVARLVSGIYRALGLISKGQLVEVDRSELVAGYLGQTATKTAEVVARAIGGVLFVDEAYSLAGDQYGEEAIDTLVKEMEDHRDDLVVIVAGYPVPMASFIAANPGLASRFRTVITFDDYTDDELTEIFSRLAAESDYTPTPACLDRFRELLRETARAEGFGNGRFARNMLEGTISRQAWRLRDIPGPTVAELRQLRPEDLTDSDPGDPPVASGPAGGTESWPGESAPGEPMIGGQPLTGTRDPWLAGPATSDEGPR